MALVTVILAMGPGPGFPAGSPEHRYVLRLALDAEGRPDMAAWATDPAPWPAQRIRPGAPIRAGDVQHDPDAGWSLRFFGDAEDRADVPSVPLLAPDGGAIRPGSYITLIEPGDAPRDYRVVGVEA
ncbi:MAG TPA: hypothetical protein VGM87_25265 [Roseomonas sp.]|jgi:hypothetical protein